MAANLKSIQFTIAIDFLLETSFLKETSSRFYNFAD